MSNKLYKYKYINDLQILAKSQAKGLKGLANPLDLNICRFKHIIMDWSLWIDIYDKIFMD